MVFTTWNCRASYDDLTAKGCRRARNPKDLVLHVTADHAQRGGSICRHRRPRIARWPWRVERTPSALFPIEVDVQIVPDHVDGIGQVGRGREPSRAGGVMPLRGDNVRRPAFSLTRSKLSSRGYVSRYPISGPQL